MFNSSRVTNKMTYNRRYSYFRRFTELKKILKLKKNKVRWYLLIYFMLKLGISQLSFPDNYMKSYACLNDNNNMPLLLKVHLSYSY